MQIWFTSAPSACVLLLLLLLLLVSLPIVSVWFKSRKETGEEEEEEKEGSKRGVKRTWLRVCVFVWVSQ